MRFILRSKGAESAEGAEGDEVAYANAQYMSESSSGNQLEATVTFVRSNVGESTGTFLFHLQLLLAMLNNVQKVSIDNYTDNPARAAIGIYSLIDVNTTGISRESMPRLKSLDERLYESEGKMRLTMSGDFFKAWIK